MLPKSTIFSIFFISVVLGAQTLKLTPYYEILKVLEDSDLDVLDKFVAKYDSPDSILCGTQNGAAVTLFMTAQFMCRFRHSERLIELKADVNFLPCNDDGCCCIILFRGGSGWMDGWMDKFKLDLFEKGRNE